MKALSSYIREGLNTEDIQEGMFDVEDTVDRVEKEAILKELIDKESKTVNAMVDVFIRNTRKFGEYVPINQKCATAFNNFLKEISWRAVSRDNEWWKNPPYETNQLGVYTGNRNVQSFSMYVLDLEKKGKMVRMLVELDWNSENMYFNIESVDLKDFVKNVWNASGVIKKYVMNPIMK